MKLKMQMTDMVVLWFVTIKNISNQGFNQRLFLFVSTPKSYRLDEKERAQSIPNIYSVLLVTTVLFTS